VQNLSSDWAREKGEMRAENWAGDKIRDRCVGQPTGGKQGGGNLELRPPDRRGAGRGGKISGDDFSQEERESAEKSSFGRSGRLTSGQRILTALSTEENRKATG